MLLSYKKELIKKFSSIRKIIVEKGKFIYPLLTIAVIVLFFGLRMVAVKGSFFSIAPLKIKVVPTLVPTITLSPTPTEIPTPTPIPYLTASGEYSDQDKKAFVQIRFPKYGGTITGQVTGACILDVKGQYDRNKNEITGNATGKCNNLGSAVAKGIAKGTFRGILNTVSKKIEVDFDGGVYPNAPYDNTSLHISYAGKHVSLTIK